MDKLKTNARWTLIQVETFIIKQYHQHSQTLNRMLHPITLLIILGLIAFLTIYDLVFLLPKYLGNVGIVYILNLVWCSYVLLNIFGNFWLCARTTSSFVALPKERQQPIPTEVNQWKMCTHCQILVPPRARHCHECKCCMLKRDHHCHVTNICIGHANQRYFIAWLFHCTLGCVISLIYNVLSLWQHRAFIIQHPELFIYMHMHWYRIYVEYNRISIWWMFSTITILVNILGLLLSVGMLCLQLFMVSRGSTLRSIMDRDYDFGFWPNMRQVFGKRMFWILLSPWVHSPLPQDGTRWQQPLDYENKKPA